jgi:hypothetical protein
MTKLTRTQALAVARLKQHGGTGVMLKNGCVLAGGDVLRAGDDPENDDDPADKFQRSTWKALALAGEVTIFKGRVTVKEKT